MQDDKYKAFRQYMTNELGVTRQDIEAWTKQSVANEVQKKLGQLNIDQLVRDSIIKATNDALRGYSTTGVKEELARQLASQIQLTVRA